MPVDSVDAMIQEAEKQGWLEGRDLGFVPELVSLYRQASEYFTEVLDDCEPLHRQGLLLEVCRYLFAKGVEGVILWGISSDGKISVYFDEAHLYSPLVTEVPQHLHAVVEDSLSVGESMFKAHMDFVMHKQAEGASLDLRKEVHDTISWVPRLGVSYALRKQMHVLR